MCLSAAVYQPTGELKGPAAMKEMLARSAPDGVILRVGEANNPEGRAFPYSEVRALRR